jgi:hypothetical protein
VCSRCGSFREPWHLAVSQGRQCAAYCRRCSADPLAIRKVGHRYQEAGLERALCEKERRGAAELLKDSQSHLIIAMICCGDPPPVVPSGPCGWWPKFANIPVMDPASVQKPQLSRDLGANVLRSTVICFRAQNGHIPPQAGAATLLDSSFISGHPPIRT